MKRSFSYFLSFTLLMLLALTLPIAQHRADARESRLSQLYTGAVLSAMHEMEEMEHTLQKLLLSGDEQARGTYLAQVSAGAGQVQQSLMLLPLSHPNTMQAVKLTNQLADYARALSEKADITQEDTRQLAELMEVCRAYTLTLQQNAETLSGLAREEHSFFPAGEEQPLDHSVSYPTLIYDGPFSDARSEAALPFDEETEIDRDEAIRIARAMVGEDIVLSAAPGTDTYGPNPCYGVTLTLPDVTLEAAVSKKGGKVLWLSPDNAAFSSEITLEQCRQSAQAFLQRNGFPPMENTFFQVYEGVAVLAFAAKEGDVLLYPDLVKVQLRMDTGAVVGLESKNYWQNHKRRYSLTPAITAREAEGMVNKHLQVLSSRLCLIPLDNREILCWEFHCTWQDKEYRVYINAQTGQQEEILQILESGRGLEAI